MTDYPPISIDRIWSKGGRDERTDTKNGGSWRGDDLARVVENEPVYEIPLIFIDMGSHYFKVEEGGLIEFARHMKHVMECDLEVPIILDEWGSVMDGRHRLVKAMIEGRATIKAKRVPQGTSATYYS